MSHRPCAVVGVGQTKHAAKRQDVSMPGLVREAAKRALEDAQLDWSDIDAVVIGKAPDMFEGLVQPELVLAGALGAVGKPMMRVHTAGSVGGSTAIVASHLVTSGKHRRVLTVAYEKQSESNAMWALSQRFPFMPPVAAGAGGYFAPVIRAYMRRTGAPESVGAKVAFKDRRNALKNPYAHLHMPELTLEAIQASPMLWDPIRYHETCPSSDGAVAMVLSDEAVGPRPPAWVLSTPQRTQPLQLPEPAHVEPPARAPSRRRLRQIAVRGRGHHAGSGRRRGALRSVLLVRANVARERRAGRVGVARRRRRRDRDRWAHPHQLLRRRALHQPHRGQRDVAVR